MELNQAVATLQDEVKLLKGEIKTVLKEIRTAVISDNNPFAIGVEPSMVRAGGRPGPGGPDAQQEAPPMRAELAPPTPAPAPPAAAPVGPTPQATAAPVAPTLSAAPVGPTAPIIISSSGPSLAPTPPPGAQLAAPTPWPAAAPEASPHHGPTPLRSAEREEPPERPTWARGPTSPSAAAPEGLPEPRQAPAESPAPQELRRREQGTAEPSGPDELPGREQGTAEPSGPQEPTERQQAPAESPAPRWNLLTIAGLTAWAEDAVAALGPQRFQIVLELACFAEIVSPEVRDVLGRVAELAPANEVKDRPTNVNECLVALYQLEAILQGEKTAKLSRRRGGLLARPSRVR